MEERHIYFSASSEAPMMPLFFFTLQLLLRPYDDPPARLKSGGVV